jgi:hypothetical protein
MRPFSFTAGFMTSVPKVLPETKAAAVLLRWTPKNREKFATG